MMASHCMILFHTTSRYLQIFNPSVLSNPIAWGISLQEFWFCSTMMLMEKAEMMEATIILAGIVVLKVIYKFDAS